MTSRKKRDKERDGYPSIVEDRIRGSKALNKLLDFVDGTPTYDEKIKTFDILNKKGKSVYMTKEQVDTAHKLLKKVAPDKREVAHTGAGGEPLEVYIVASGDGLEGHAEGYD